MTDTTFKGALIKAVDAVYEAADREKKGGRGHLGASVLGRKCVRQIWYGFRWAHITRHKGRLLRLFERGKLEELRILRQLSDAGLEVRPFSKRLVKGGDGWALRDWEQPIDVGSEYDCSLDSAEVTLALAAGVELGQDHFSDHRGHFGGEGDGRVKISEALLKLEPKATGWGLFESKTHNTKSFVNLVNKGVISAKLEHYIQMQTYMHYFGLRWALYVAVNKNDDDLHFEVVYYKPEVALRYADRASAVIEAREAPERISNDPSWFECKYCDFREVCHHGKPPQKNCRSCAYAVPSDDGEWHCLKHNGGIPKGFIPDGCGAWEPIR